MTRRVSAINISHFTVHMTDGGTAGLEQRHVGPIQTVTVQPHCVKSIDLFIIILYTGRCNAPLYAWIGVYMQNVCIHLPSYSFSFSNRFIVVNVFASKPPVH